MFTISGFLQNMQASLWAFGLSLSSWPNKPPHRVAITPFVALAAILACVGVVRVKCVSEACLYQAFIADVTFRRGVELYPVLFCHYDRLFVG